MYAYVESMWACCVCECLCYLDPSHAPCALVCLSTHACGENHMLTRAGIRAGTHAQHLLYVSTQIAYVQRTSIYKHVSHTYTCMHKYIHTNRHTLHAALIFIFRNQLALQRSHHVAFTVNQHDMRRLKLFYKLTCLYEIRMCREGNIVHSYAQRDLSSVLVCVCVCVCVCLNLLADPVSEPAR